MPEFTPRSPDFINRARQTMAKQPFAHTLGLELVRIEPGFIEFHLPFTADLGQQHGYYHGGVIGALADNCGGFATGTLLADEDSLVTVEYKVNFLSPADGEMLIGRGQVLRAGSKLTTCRSDIYSLKDGKEKLCATALGTFMTLKGISETE